MFAFRIARRFGDGERVDKWPECKRLRDVGPLTWWREGDATVVAIKPICPQPIPPGDLLPGEPTADGLEFLPPKTLPTRGELRHDLDSLPYVIELTMADGKPLDIVPATAAPRRVLWTANGAEAGEPIGEYASVADRLHQIALRQDEIRKAYAAKPSDVLAKEADKLAAEDQRLTPRCVLLAIQQAYYVTPEMLNLLGWISTADIDQIILAAWGIDPKTALELGSGAGG